MQQFGQLIHAHPLIALLLALVIAAVVTVAVAPRMAAGLKDANLKDTKALPNGAATVYSTGIDTQLTTAQGVQPGNVDWQISGPALATGVMGDAKTLKYSILHDDALPIDSGSTVLMADYLTQTGAGGAGCAAASKKYRLPPDAKRYIGFKVVGSASGDCSGSSGTNEVLA